MTVRQNYLLIELKTLKNSLVSIGKILNNKFLVRKDLKLFDDYPALLILKIASIGLII